MKNTINDSSGKSFRIPPLSRTTQTLCAVCQGLGGWFLTNWTSSPRCLNTYSHYSSWDALYDSACKGCAFCYQVAIIAEDFFIGGTISHLIKTGKPTVFEADAKTDYTIKFRCNKIEWSALEVYVPPGSCWKPLRCWIEA